jgi:F420-dependent oxidoreductase-like protein
MKLGLQVPYFTYPGGAPAIGETFGRVVRDADAAGFASFWVMDHFFQVGGVGPSEREMLESYSALSYAAALSRRMKLGALVTGITYRHPGLLIKTVTTLDVLSGGRAYLGIGAAWNEPEHVGLGVPFPPLAERFARLEDTLQLAHQMWSDQNDAPFDGQQLHLGRTLNAPQAVSTPHPPILIGGEGEQKTFRLIARYADACNIMLIVPKGEDYRAKIDTVRQKYTVLRERCAEIGRPYAQIEKTTLSTVLVTKDGTRPDDVYPTRYEEALMTPTQAIEYFHAVAEAGTDHAIFLTPIVHQPGALDIWATDIFPAVAKFVPAGR